MRKLSCKNYLKIYQMNSEIPCLRAFSKDMLENKSGFLIVGKRSSGKTTLIKDLLLSMESTSVAAIIASGQDHRNQYLEFSDRIHTTMDSKVGLDIVDTCMKKHLVDLKSWRAHYPDDYENAPKIGIIFDHCMLSADWKKSAVMGALMQLQRNYRICPIIGMTYVDMSPVWRNTLDWVFLFKDDVIVNQERLYHYFAGIFPDFDIFRRTMDAYTEKYGCLAINLALPSNKIEDVIFWYRVTF